MPSIHPCLGALALVVVAGPLAAQSARQEARPEAPAARTEEAARPFPLLFGVAGGALSYEGGRREQALGAVVRWVATPWLSVSTTPTAVRVREPSALTQGAFVGRTGMVDLPVDATVQHTFKAPWSPGVSLALGASLPLGDTASGFGAGKVGYSASAGLGFSPTSRVWVYLGAGRSLTDVMMQSAFSGSSGWGDASAGYSLTDRVGVSGGVSTDLGAVDSLIGHSRSVNGGFSYVVRGPATLNVNASRGLSGLAPKWSLAVGVGTAFPYLTRVGAGSALRDTFGGGTHGLDGGTSGGSGTGGGGTPAERGRGRKPL